MVSLEAIWAAASARTCGTSRQRCQRRALGSWGPPLHSPVSSHHPGPAPIPFRDLAPKREFPPPPPPPAHLLPGSSPYFVFPELLPFPGTRWPFLPPPKPGSPSICSTPRVPLQSNNDDQRQRGQGRSRGGWAPQLGRERGRPGKRGTWGRRVGQKSSVEARLKKLQR